MDEKSKIKISISKEHASIEPDVRDFFSGLNGDIISDYTRKSTEDLPMQILIFLGGVVVSGATWDLIKFGISKLFRKYPKINITIRDGNGIMFAISKDGKVGPLVVPDRKKEFARIRNIYGLGRYLVEETDDDKLERRKRIDFVFGIVVAGIFGLIINVFSNIFYDVFLVHKINFNSYDQIYLTGLMLLLFLVLAFMQFLVYDYKNKLSLEKNFWKRYMFFLSEDFSLSRIVKVLNRFFISMFLIIFDFNIITALNNQSSFFVVGIVIFASIIFVIFKWWIKKKFKKQNCIM